MTSFPIFCCLITRLDDPQQAPDGRINNKSRTEVGPRGFTGLYLMKSSWCDTDGGRNRGQRGKKRKKKMKKWVPVGASHGEERLSARGRDWTRHQERRAEDRRCGWKTRRRKRGRGLAQSYGREVVLTVGHTLILDLQVLVGSRAGVREDVRTRDHDALGPVVASGGGREAERRSGG